MFYFLDGFDYDSVCHFRMMSQEAYVIFIIQSVGIFSQSYELHCSKGTNFISQIFLIRGNVTDGLQVIISRYTIYTCVNGEGVLCRLLNRLVEDFEIFPRCYIRLHRETQNQQDLFE